MRSRFHPISDERGSAMVIALMVLSLLTLVAIAGTRTSNTEITIAGNQVAYNMVNYRTEGVAVEGALSIEALTPAALASHEAIPGADDWLWPEATAADYTDPSEWDFDDLDGDDNAEESVLDSRIAYAAIDTGVATGSSMSMTESTQVRAYRVFGYENSNNGLSVIEVGYKRRF